MIEKRSGKRHLIPEINRKYIQMEMQDSDAFIQVYLIDFSLHGLRFLSPVKQDVGSTIACKLSIPNSMSQVVLLKVDIRHIEEAEGGYILGGEIADVDDTIWLEMFKQVHDFISEREGEVY
ncbi:MAG: PilZ domain-containing protein [Proteobacteria bacterium]|nr:PilZ domain-containing protein [Pseudomonadota bacterium]